MVLPQTSDRTNVVQGQISDREKKVGQGRRTGQIDKHRTNRTNSAVINKFYVSKLHRQAANSRDKFDYHTEHKYKYDEVKEKKLRDPFFFLSFFLLVCPGFLFVLKCFRI